MQVKNPNESAFLTTFLTKFTAEFTMIFHIRARLFLTWVVLHVMMVTYIGGGYDGSVQAAAGEGETAAGKRKTAIWGKPVYNI